VERRCKSWSFEERFRDEPGPIIEPQQLDIFARYFRQGLDKYNESNLKHLRTKGDKMMKASAADEPTRSDDAEKPMTRLKH